MSDMPATMRAPSKRFARPAVRLEFFRNQLQLVPVEDAIKRAALERKISAIEKAYQRLRSTTLSKYDRAILTAVARFRLLNAYQVWQVAGSSYQYCLRRLEHLWANEFLERPAEQRSQLDQTPSCLVYGLSREGAKVLAKDDEGIDPTRDWRARNQTTHAHILHTIETANVILQFERACEALGELRLHDQPTLRKTFPPATLALDDPFRLRVTIARQRNHPLTTTVAPDRLFALTLKSEASLVFALELDRSTMEVSSLTRAGRARFKRKLEAYYQAWMQGRHNEQWGFDKSFRVLTVTPSEKRIENMIRSQREVTDHSTPGLFLYTSPKRLAEHGPLAPIWISSKEDGVSLVTS